MLALKISVKLTCVFARVQCMYTQKSIMQCMPRFLRLYVKTYGVRKCTLYYVALEMSRII